VIVDQCPEHGVWLDRGELGRLMGVAADELAALRDRLAATAPDLDQLLARRQKWRADLETRRKAALDYRQMLEEEHRQRVVIADAERKRLAAQAGHRAAGTAPTDEIAPLARPAAGAEPGAHVADPVEAARQAAKRRHELGTQRTQAAAEVAHQQGRLAAVHDHVRRLAAELAEARQRADDVQRELDTARTKLRLVDDQLAAPE
jgi:Zn-finger nucleic acid-binding protein